MSGGVDNAQKAAAFRRHARRFMWAASAGLLVSLGFIALTLLVIVMRGPEMAPQALGRFILAWTPVIFYAGALNEARRLFASLRREGLSFGPAVVRALRRIGAWLSVGGGIGLAAGGFLLVTSPPGSGGFAFLSAPALTIAVIGFALIAIARLIAEADAIRRSNRELEAELADFF